MTPSYKIVRFYLDGGTAKRARSRRAGPWFDGYTEDEGE
jgi:hypothetical protein